MFKEFIGAYNMGWRAGRAGMNDLSACPFKRPLSPSRALWETGWCTGMEISLREWLNARERARNAKSQ